MKSVYFISIGGIGMSAGARYFKARGFAVSGYDKTPSDLTEALQKEGIDVTGFYYPVVPKGQARIRVQVSAAHTREQLDKCIAAFSKIGKELSVLK